MSEDNNERIKLTTARTFIKEKRYDVARAILETLPGNKSAQSWLSKLPKATTKTPSAKGSSRIMLPVVLLIVGLSIGLGSGLMLAPDEGNQDDSQIVALNATIDAFSAEQSETPSLTPMPTDTPTITSVTFETTEESDVDPEITEIPVEYSDASVDATPPPTPVYDVQTMSMIFDSEIVGLQPVFEPIIFPSGFYDVKVTTDGTFTLDLESIDGVCTNATVGMFDLAAGDASDGITLPFGSQDCVLQIIVSSADAPWMVTFQQTSLSDSTEDIQLTYNSQDEGLDASIGPVLIPSGEYDVEIRTTGFITVNLQQLSGVCDVDIFGLFSLVEGQADDGAYASMLSDECVGLITVGNATAPWALTFTKINELEEG